MPDFDFYSDFYGDMPVWVASPPGSQWHIVSSITGDLIGGLPTPNSFTLTEPLREKGSTLELTIPMPADPFKIAELREWIRPDPARPYIRSIVWEDTATGQLLFGGPIVMRPHRDGANITISAVDWRTWFYYTQYRPLGAKFDTARTPYKATNREQTLIQNDLAKLALESYGDPMMVVDDPATSGVNRDLTVKLLQGGSLGEWIDDIMKRDRGSEWFTYMEQTSDATWLPHFSTYWPERRSYAADPIQLVYREGEGGNVAALNWPGAAIAPSRIYTVDGAEDIVLFSSASLAGIAKGTELLWEDVQMLADGTVKKTTAFERALGHLKTATGYDGPIQLTVLAEKLPFTDYVTGDRFQVTVEDNWDSMSFAAARCTQRVLQGAQGEPTQQVLTLDINDNRFPDDGTNPGRLVTL